MYGGSAAMYGGGADGLWRGSERAQQELQVVVRLGQDLGPGQGGVLEAEQAAGRVLRACYAMPGTDVAYAAALLHTMSGTDTACAAAVPHDSKRKLSTTSHEEVRSPSRSRATRHVSAIPRTDMRVCDAICSTMRFLAVDFALLPPNRVLHAQCPVLTERRVLRDARYWRSVWYYAMRGSKEAYGFAMSGTDGAMDLRLGRDDGAIAGRRLHRPPLVLTQACSGTALGLRLGFPLPCYAASCTELGYGATRRSGTSYGACWSSL
eukprot:3823916-Rhodomonas_salina.3